MNNKLIAATMAVIMAVVGLTVVAADGSDAVDVERVTVGKQIGTTIAVNEGNYTHSDNYVLTFEIFLGETSTSSSDELKYTVNKGDSNTSKTWYVTNDAISGTDTNSSNFIVTIAQESKVGVYTVTVEGEEVTTDPITFSIVASITVTIGSDSKTFDDFAKFTRSIEVYRTGGQDKIDVTIATGAKVGNFYDQQIVWTNNTVPDYDWYAVGLAPGLAMSSDGHVSGIPTADGMYNFKVYATDSDGNIYFDDVVEFSVAKKDPSTETPSVGFTYDIYVNGEDSNSFIVASGSTVVVKLFTDEDVPQEITQGATVNFYKANATQDSAVESVTYGQSGGIDGYVLTNLSGSGAYLVSVSYNGYTDSFFIQVIAGATSIDASIVIDGA